MRPSRAGSPGLIPAVSRPTAAVGWGCWLLFFLLWQAPLTLVAQDYSIEWKNVAAGGTASTCGLFSGSLRLGQPSTWAPTTNGPFALTGRFFALPAPNAPRILTQPQSATNDAGSTVVFSVTAAGLPPLAYYWFKNGSALADGGNVSGATSNVLTLAGVLGADSGAYQVVVSNSLGSATSRAASLTVRDPVIVTNPVNQCALAGQIPALSVVAVGTQPLAYQWWRNGSAVNGATAATLVLTNAGCADAGSYFAIVQNSLGCATSTVATLNVRDPFITLHPMSASREAGQSVTFSVGAVGTPPLGYQWRQEGLARPGATAATLSLSNLVGSDAGRYDAIVTNACGGVTSSVATLTVNRATLDTNFIAGADGSVRALVAQPDRKVLVFGSFTQLGGQPCTNLGRLNADGSLDTTFRPQFGTHYQDRIDSIVVQDDGRILVGGHFTWLCGQIRQNLGRLNPDGTLDAGFDPQVVGDPSGFGYPCPLVEALALQADGKILVGGCFTTLGGHPRRNLGRLNPDGTLDTGFRADTDSTVMSLAVQPNGMIVAGGFFSTLAGQPRAHLGRLYPDGTLDEWLQPSLDREVRSVIIDMSGRILVGGAFAWVDWLPRTNLARFWDDGTLDESFHPEASEPWPSSAHWVDSLTAQADGDILVGGAFSLLNGEPRNGIGRLDDLGRLDLTFNPAPLPERAYCFALQPDGGVVVGGGFTNLAGRACANLGRLNPAGAVINEIIDFFVGQNLLTWRRFGPSPEIQRATFEFSTNGTEWTLLGQGTRFGSEWVLVGVSKPVGGVVRARGYTPESLVECYYPDVWVTQLANQVRCLGEDATFSVTVLSSLPLWYQWRHGGLEIPGATDPSLTLTNLQTWDEGSYAVMVSSPPGFLRAYTYPADLTINCATLDLAFNPGPNAQVTALALQPDGQVLVGGYFTELGGQARERLGRLLPDGSVDVAFAPAANDGVRALAVQPDGKLLVGGYFTELAGQRRDRLGRLNPDGTIDLAFDPGADGLVAALAIQTDGRILVGGNFTWLGGQPRAGLARLQASGAVDPDFNPGASSTVSTLALTADGSLLVGGGFASLAGQPCFYLGRLHPEGTFDATFNAGMETPWVSALAPQADNRIVIGGWFGRVAGQARLNLARLEPDGALDVAFRADVEGPTLEGPQHPQIHSAAVQADGKVLLAGQFARLGGRSRHHLGRLMPDGTPDPTFNPGAGYFPVYALAPQPDGKLLVGGAFTNLAGQARRNLGRLNATEPATQSLSYDGARLTWLRGGTSPEVLRATFELSTNATTWSLLGQGTRIAGGWSLVGLPLLPKGVVRARGQVAGGVQNGSSWFVASTLAVDPNTPPRVLTTGTGFGYQTNGFGFNATGLIGQTVVIEGSTDLLAWAPIGTNRFRGTILRFVDSTATSSPYRFYRLRLQ